MVGVLEQGGFFNAEPGTGKKPHTIMIPLPNVTGALHMGHALNGTCQDLVTRWKRMQGYEALWMPGTDHAGIATQAVVERRMQEEEGLTRHDIGAMRSSPASEVERRLRSPNHLPAEAIGLLLRLAACTVHVGRCLLQSGAADFLQDVPGRVHLPRQAAGQLGLLPADCCGG